MWSKQTVCRASSSASSSSSSSSNPYHALTKPCILGRSNESASKSSLALPELSSSVESRMSSVDTPSARAHTQHLKDGRYMSHLRVNKIDKHYTPVDLQRIVKSIKEKQMSVQSIATLSRSLSNRQKTMDNRIRPQETTPRPMAEQSLRAPHSSVSTTSTAATSNASDISYRRPSKESTSTEMSSHGVVRGFSVGCVSSSYRSQTQNEIQHGQFPKQNAQMSADLAKKKAAKFVLGCSSDEGGESSSEANTFQPHSYLSEELKKSGPTKGQAKLQGGFVSTKPILDRSYESEEVFESEDEEDRDDDGVSESAIDDDDDDDAWEDSDTEDGRTAAMEDKHLFQRVDSRANLTSRRSLLTTMMHEKDRKQELASVAGMNMPSRLRRSRTTSPNGPSLATSPDGDAEMVKVAGRPIPQPKPIIMTTSNLHAPPYSPRTTRRNMLTTELTESLRKHILWERQQKNVTANAALKRRHTSHDVKNLRQYPKGKQREPFLEKEETSKTNSWNHYFDNGLQEYHQKGW